MRDAPGTFGDSIFVLCIIYKYILLYWGSATCENTQSEVDTSLLKIGKMVWPTHVAPAIETHVAPAIESITLRA